MFNSFSSHILEFNPSRIYFSMLEMDLTLFFQYGRSFFFFCLSFLHWYLCHLCHVTYLMYEKICYWVLLFCSCFGYLFVYFCVSTTLFIFLFFFYIVYISKLQCKLCVSYVKFFPSLLLKVLMVILALCSSKERFYEFVKFYRELGWDFIVITD